MNFVSPPKPSNSLKLFYKIISTQSKVIFQGFESKSLKREASKTVLNLENSDNYLEGLHLSGNDSGTASIMKSTSRMATIVATATTTFSLYICSK